MTRLLATFVAAAVVAVCVPSGIEAATMVPEPAAVYRGCVIRFDQLNAAGTLVVPRVLNDEHHFCLGVTGVSVAASGDLVIQTENLDRIITGFAEEDETLVMRNVDCGPSIGLTVTNVTCAINGVRVRADSLALYSSKANLWMGWISWVDP